MPLVRGAHPNPGGGAVSAKARLQQEQQPSYSELEDLLDSEDDSKSNKDQADLQLGSLAKATVETLEDDLEDEIEQSTGFQPAPVEQQLPRGRLQRNDQQASRQRTADAALDDLLAGVQRMGLNNPHVKQRSTESTPKPNAGTLLASECKLPSSDDEAVSNEDEDTTSNSSEEEPKSRQQISEPSTSRPLQPLSKPQQLPSKPPGSSTTTINHNKASEGKQHPAQGSLVLSDPAGRKLVLSPQLHSKLYPHQVEGVRWLWSLFVSGKGGILGDDMVRDVRRRRGLLWHVLLSRRAVPGTACIPSQSSSGVCHNIVAGLVAVTTRIACHSAPLPPTHLTSMRCA